MTKLILRAIVFALVGVLSISAMTSTPVAAKVVYYSTGGGGSGK